MRKRGKIALLGGVAAAALGALGSPTAHAELSELEQLKRDMQNMQARIAQLEQEQAAAKKSDLKVKWKGAPEVSSADGKFKVKMRGRLYVDYADTDGDVVPGGTHDYIRKTEFRAARLGIEGLMFGNMKYKFEVDFANNEVTVKDAYIEWKKPFQTPLNVSVGQFKTPNSLEEQTSSRYTTFMERAAFTDAFDLARQIGVAVGTHGDNWTVKAGAFGEPLEESSAAQEGWTAAGRATFAPLDTDDMSLHLGASIRYRDFGNSDQSVRYRQRPQVHQEAKYVETGIVTIDAGADGVPGTIDDTADLVKLPAGSDLFYGFEAAGVWGPFSLQGEYAMIKPDMLGGAGNPGFNGWYISASWFLTGEKRTYKASKGSFDRIKVKNPVQDGGLGAWQVAVRYDSLDLNDKSIMGGKQNAVVAGLNWYLNDHTRTMFNYIHAEIKDVVENPLSPGESLVVSGTPVNNDIDAFQFRAQIDF